MKPFEVIGLLVGLAGLGVTGWLVWDSRRKSITPPPAAVSGGSVPQVRVTVPGFPAPGSPPVGQQTSNIISQVGNTVGQVANTVKGVVDTVQQLGDFFGSLNFGF